MNKHGLDERATSSSWKVNYNSLNVNNNIALYHNLDLIDCCDVQHKEHECNGIEDT